MGGVSGVLDSLTYNQVKVKVLFGLTRKLSRTHRLLLSPTFLRHLRKCYKDCNHNYVEIIQGNDSRIRQTLAPVLSQVRETCAS